jgi:hypothetical protein
MKAIQYSSFGNHEFDEVRAVPDRRQGSGAIVNNASVGAYVRGVERCLESIERLTKSPRLGEDLEL